MRNFRAGSIAIVLATGLIASWEGKRNTAYLDLVHVPTICYGHTKDVRLGDVKSDTECTRLLRAEIGRIDTVLAKSVDRTLPPTVRAAVISFIYNVGDGAFARSTLRRHLRSGNYIAACNELPRWVYAGGKRVRGLVIRREAERKLCLGDTRVQ